MTYQPTPSTASTVKPLDIAIVGETNLDLIMPGLPEQIPVEVEVLASGFSMTLGGSSSILAHNLSLLGAHVGFTSLLGDDAMADIALARLAEAGLDTTHVARRAQAATGVTILLPHGRKRHILTYPGVMEQLTVSDLDPAFLASARHFHLSSLFLQTGLHPGLPQLFDDLHAAGLTLSLDTNDDPSGRWNGILPTLLDKIDLLLPNEDEVLKIAGQPTLESALDALAPRIPLIAVKCGARGAIIQQGTQRTWVNPILVDPVDTIGAGDSFNAGFLRAWLDGHDPLQAAAFGNLTGALSSLRPGGTEAFRDTTLRNAFLSLHAPAQSSLCYFR
ncbi:MAG: carbohydrate kinase family protein [Acidobacteriaceae bacterium]